MRFLFNKTASLMEQGPFDTSLLIKNATFITPLTFFTNILNVNVIAYILKSLYVPEVR